MVEAACSTYNADGDACLNAYIKRMPGGVADGTYSPCEYSPDDPDRYKPEDDYDARCHSSQVRLECDFETVSPEADADTDAETDADAPCVDAPEDDVVAKLKEGFHYDFGAVNCEALLTYNGGSLCNDPEYKPYCCATCKALCIHLLRSQTLYTNEASGVKRSQIHDLVLVVKQRSPSSCRPSWGAGVNGHRFVCGCLGTICQVLQFLWWLSPCCSPLLLLPSLQPPPP